MDRFTELMGEKMKAGIDMRFLQGTQYLSRVFHVLDRRKRGYIDADDLVAALMHFSKDKANDGRISLSRLQDLAADILATADTNQDHMISRHEFMRMPRLRIGEAPALLNKVVNTIRTGNLTADALRSARLDLYWRMLFEKVRSGARSRNATCISAVTCPLVPHAG